MELFHYCGLWAFESRLGRRKKPFKNDWRPPMDLDVNRKPVSVDCDPATPLLWVLRDHLNLTGTK